MDEAAHTHSREGSRGCPDIDDWGSSDVHGPRVTAVATDASSCCCTQCLGPDGGPSASCPAVAVSLRPEGYCSGCSAVHVGRKHSRLANGEHGTAVVGLGGDILGHKHTCFGCSARRVPRKPKDTCPAGYMPMPSSASLSAALFLPLSSALFPSRSLSFCGRSPPPPHLQECARTFGKKQNEQTNPPPLRTYVRNI